MSGVEGFEGDDYDDGEAGVVGRASDVARQALGFKPWGGVVRSDSRFFCGVCFICTEAAEV